MQITFHDILQRKLKDAPGLRPPKLELTGLLVPCDRVVEGYHCKFKLETASREYFLLMSDSLARMARKIEWDEVTVRGFMHEDTDLFEVEKITLPGNSEATVLDAVPKDAIFELDHYKRAITTLGKIDLAPEYAAS